MNNKKSIENTKIRFFVGTRWGAKKKCANTNNMIAAIWILDPHRQ